MELFVVSERVNNGMISGGRRHNPDGLDENDGEALLALVPIEISIVVLSLSNGGRRTR